MSSAAQTVADAVKATVSTTVTAVSNATTTAIHAATTTAPPTAPYETSTIGEPAEGEKDQHPLLSPRDEIAKEKLEKLMGARPDRKDLVEKNILKNPNVAPSLQAKQAELERSQLEDKLESKLQARPSPEELVKEGILLQDEVPSA